jgi:hypothetical protein
MKKDEVTITSYYFTNEELAQLLSLQGTLQYVECIGNCTWQFQTKQKNINTTDTTTKGE